MNKTVYFYSPAGPEVSAILHQHGYTITEGDGTAIDPRLLAECDIYVPGKSVVTREVLQAAPKLKLISKAGVGMDRVDLEACTEMGIWAANTPLVNYITVAEHAVTLILAAAKQIYPISLRLRAETPDWKAAFKAAKAIELCGKTVALIGFGHIGRRTARLLSGFDMHILAYDPYTDKTSVPDYVTLTETLEEALQSADIVSIHAAGSDSTRHLIGEKELAMMKPTAILVNTTRGFVIDEQALIKALNDHVIAGAALDVFEKEPADPDNPLFRMENVLATPHSAANTPESSLRSQQAVAENILTYAESGIPVYACNRPDPAAKKQRTENH